LKTRSLKYWPHDSIVIKESILHPRTAKMDQFLVPPLYRCCSAEDVFFGEVHYVLLEDELRKYLFLISLSGGCAILKLLTDAIS